MLTFKCGQDQSCGLGGNPLTKAHLTACKAAGITGFRVHDWRHDWAARLAREGVSMPGLMQLGGWRQMRMVQVYASLQADHLREQLARIA